MLHRWLILAVALASASFTAQAQETPPPPPVQAEPSAPPQPAQPDAPSPSRTAEPNADQDVEVERAPDSGDVEIDDDDRRFKWRTREDGVVLHIGEDARLRAGEEAKAVVAVFGSAFSDGDVDESVVSVFGDARSAGRVGDAVVALLGDAYVDGYVSEDVVAVLGNVKLGPNAEVDGEVTAVGGQIIRDPGAIVNGPQHIVGVGEHFIELEGLRQWIRHCLLLARPLAFEPGLGWAWGVAFAFLAFYVLLALLFGDAMNKCVDTLEERPGESVLTAILSVLLTPVAFFVLLITIVGIALMPFLGLALFVASLFGKAVVFGWLGRRITQLTGVGALSQIALAVLIGGLIMMLVYVVPVLGFIAYKVAGLIGLGVVLFTLVLAIRAKRAAAAPVYAAPVAVAAQGGPTEGATPTAPGAAIAAAGPVIDLSAPRAGFWIRMGALLIDVIVVAVAVSFLADDSALLILLAAYGALMWKLKGTTVGGMVCNLHVIRVDGQPIEWDTAVVRALSCFVSAIPAGLGFIWIAFDPERQAWHDKIAGTVVVRAPRIAQSTVQTAPSA